MSTTAELLTTLCHRLADERNTLVERLAAVSSEQYDPTDLRKIADLQGTLLAAEAAREMHLPKIGSGSEV